MDPIKAKRARHLRRRRRIRKKIFGTAERPRLTVTRSLKQIRCQVIDDARGVTLASASSLTPEVRGNIGSKSGNREGATMVGALLAKRIEELGIRKLAFDRNGYRYHGRVASLVDALRKQGIEV